MEKEICIIGAGLTGLTLAFYLKKRGKPFILIEKEKQVGGVIDTHQEKGFTFESGPNTGVLSSHEIIELFEDLSDNCSLEVARPNAKKRLILKNGQWHALPGSPSAGLRTPLFTASDKFRLLGEPFRKKGNDPFETVADLVIRRMGKSFLDYAVDPFISGIYAGDPGTLVTRFALPKLYNLEQQYGSFIGGAIKKGFEKKTEKEKKISKEVFSVKGGLKNMIIALEKKIGHDNIKTGCDDILVNKEKNGYTVLLTDANGKHLKTDTKKVILTTGAYTLKNILPFVPDDDINPVTKLEYARIIQVAVGFKHWKGMDLNAFGGLIPSKEGKDILGILFPSSMFENRAPMNGALLSVFMGGMKNPGIMEKNDQQIREIVMHEMKHTMDAGKKVPDVFKIFRYPHAIPQYDASSEKRLKHVQLVEKKNPGLILAGNIRDGIGMSDRVKQAVNIAMNLA